MESAYKERVLRTKLTWVSCFDFTASNISLLSFFQSYKLGFCENGGSGYTVAWGCAGDVCELTEQYFSKPASRYKLL